MLLRPSPEAVREELERILASRSFAGKSRHLRLLRHLVERTLEGRASELKEWTLGTELFERPESFDPRTDPIVRVEMTRLRARLRQYYAQDGAADAVRVGIPAGAYAAAFETLGADAPAPPAPHEERGGGFPGWRVVATVAALVALGLAASLLPRSKSASRADSSATYTQLTNDAGEKRYPSLSPDGESFIYSIFMGGHWEIHQRRAGGATSLNLTAGGAGNSMQGAWSADGKLIAFRGDRDGGGIFVMGPGGESVRRLTEGGYHPAWSPDGGEVVYSTDTFTRPERRPSTGSRLEAVRLATGERRVITGPGAGGDAIQPAWSPHGFRIAYWGVNGKGHRDRSRSRRMPGSTGIQCGRRPAIPFTSRATAAAA